MKLSEIMIGSVFGIILFMSLFTFLTDGITQYGVAGNLPSDFNSSYIIIKGELDNVNRTTAGIKAQLESISAPDRTLFDYLGFFFTAGYQALTGAGQIFNSMFVISSQAIQVTGGMGDGGLLKTGAWMAIIIIFFVGILMHAVIKSDRL